MKNKSLFISIIVVLGFLVGLKPMFVQMLGEHAGILTIAVIALLYQVAVYIAKTFYNSGTWMKGWSTKFMWLNIVMAIPMVIGIFQAWAGDSGVTLHNGLLDVMSKIVVYCNFAIVLLSADWKTLISSYQLPEDGN